jgi:tetratricopeptide (TPR) repeat protein
MKRVRLIVILFFIGKVCFAQSQSVDESGRQYDQVIKDYLNGVKDYLKMPNAARYAKNSHNDTLANRIASDYIENYIIAKHNLLTEDNLKFFVEFNTDADNEGFKTFISNQDKIDKIMSQPGFARNYIDFMVAKEYVDPSLVKASGSSKAPDWKHMESQISKKFGSSIAKKVLINSQIRWYTFRNDTAQIIKYTVQKIDLYGVDTVGFAKPELNNLVYYMIFMTCDDTQVLNKAIDWMKLLTDIEPDNGIFLDTYANLLYKVGRKKEAINHERKAIELSPQNAELIQAWQKMQDGHPTWPERTNN